MCQPKAAWYIPCVRWSRGEANGKIGGGRLISVVRWVCGMGGAGIDFEKVLWLGEHDRNLLGR